MLRARGCNNTYIYTYYEGFASGWQKVRNDAKFQWFHQKTQLLVNFRISLPARCETLIICIYIHIIASPGPPDFAKIMDLLEIQHFSTGITKFSTSGHFLAPRCEPLIICRYIHIIAHPKPSFHYSSLKWLNFIEFLEIYEFSTEFSEIQHFEHFWCKRGWIMCIYMHIMQSSHRADKSAEFH